MKKDTALFVAGVVFAIVALGHLLRVYYQFPILFGDVHIPIWVNVIGLLISAGLSIWMFFSISRFDR